MQMAPNRHAESLRDAVASYVDAIVVPTLDERDIAARRSARAVVRAPFRRLARIAALATAAALAIFHTVDASAVVAGMQRVLAAFTLVGGRTVPMSVRDVDLARARADVPFAIVVPPALPGTTMSLREIRSSASPASDSIVFEISFRRPGSEFSIVENRDGIAPRHMYLSVRGPDRGDAKVAPLPAFPKPASGAGTKISLIGNLGHGSFVPDTWVTHGTRIVLISQPGILSTAQTRAIRIAMSN
jgi:hypothetical protein